MELLVVLAVMAAVLGYETVKMKQREGSHGGDKTVKDGDPARRN